MRCLIDECANIGQIPKLEKLVATIRSREISACLVLQAQSQLKAIYKDNADTIIEIWTLPSILGGKEPTTLKELSAVLGKRPSTLTIPERAVGGKPPTRSTIKNWERADESGRACRHGRRQVHPSAARCAAFPFDKYDITKHPNFKYTADANKKNAFDIEAFLSARLKLKPNEICDVYEVDAKGA